MLVNTGILIEKGYIGHVGASWTITPTVNKEDDPLIAIRPCSLTIKIDFHMLWVLSNIYND